MSYGFVSPIANGLSGIYNSEAAYFKAIKAGLVAHLSGYAPAISVEYARKGLPDEVKPTFQEVEEATAALPPA
jgi:chemotaxis protein MotA